MTSVETSMNVARKERLSRLGILNEPLGYADGMNVYQYERSNPSNNLDPLGMYTINWGNGFTNAEKTAITNSFNRIQTRVGTLLNEINKALGNETCPAARDALNKMKKTFGGMQSDLAGDHFDLEKTSFNPDAAVRWKPGFGTDIEFNTGAKKPWNTLGNSELDSSLFHEMTHEQGTDDGEANDDFNNAHMLETLMNNPLSSFMPLKVLRLKSCPPPTTKQASCPDTTANA